MSKESLYSNYPKLIFRECFNSESESRKINNAEPTDVDFSNGVGSFNGSTSLIGNKDSFNGTYSVRIRVKITSFTAVNYFVDFRGTNNDGVGRIYTNATTGDLTTTSGTKYVNGVSSSTTLLNSMQEIIVTGITIQSGTGTYQNIIGNNLTPNSPLTGDIDLFEIYQGTLTASEVANLYNDTWNKEQVFSGSAKSNVVTNGTFDSDVTGWSALRSDLTWQTGGFCRLTENNGGGASIAIIQTGIKIDGKKYKITFRAKSPDLTAVAFGLGSVYWVSSSANPIKNPDMTTEWQDYEFEAISIGTEFRVYTDATVGDGVRIDMDDIVLQELNPKTLIDFDSTNGVLEDRTVGNTVGEQLLSNNDFTNGQTGWQFWYGNDTATFTDNQMYMPGDSNRYYQSNVTEVGKKYRAIIKYKSDLSWGAGNSSYTSNIDASEDWATAIIEFVMVSQPHFYITAMTANSNVYVDYIILKEIRDDISATDVTVNKNGALFNGTSSKIDTGSTFNGLTKAVTVMGWIKPYSFGESSAGHFITNDKFKIILQPSSIWLFSSDGGVTYGISASNSVKFNKHQFIALTRESDGTVNFRIGDKSTAPVLSGSADQASGTPVAGTTNVIIGNNNGQTRTFDGLIPQVKIVEGILSLQEITNYWSSSLREIN